ncbi:hypothetical protein OAO01_05550, partial [Oligoflexia bacterium]|nr:hypothetical protein [Oligoflexia bacterium]
MLYNLFLAGLAILGICFIIIGDRSSRNLGLGLLLLVCCLVAGKVISVQLLQVIAAIVVGTVVLAFSLLCGTQNNIQDSSMAQPRSHEEHNYWREGINPKVKMSKGVNNRMASALSSTNAGEVQRANQTTPHD